MSDNYWGLETKLGGSHDIAFPIPDINTTRKDRYFRIVLLSPEDVESKAAHQKIERASVLNGGADVAIFFLLKHPGSPVASGKRKRSATADEAVGEQGKGRKNAMKAFLELQIVAAQYDTAIPLVPVSSLSELPEALASFRQTLSKESSPSTSGDKQQLEATRALLLKSCCVPDKPPLSEAQKDTLATYLTDSFADLATKAGTAEGQRELAQHLGERDGQRVVSFFAREIVPNG